MKCRFDRDAPITLRLNAMAAISRSGPGFDDKADVGALVLVAGHSARNQGQSRTIAAHLPIRQFLPDRGRILGLGSNGCRNPILRRAGSYADGARRIRTADLLGAIQALCQLSYSPGLCGVGSWSQFRASDRITA
jgi:hypothetical protein